MSEGFKSVLTGLLPQEEKEGAVSPAVPYAIALAKRSGAHLTFHAFVPQLSWVPYSAWTSVPAELAASEKKRLHALAEEAIKKACSLAETEQVACTTDTPELALEGLTDQFNRQTRLHDITVLGAGYDTLSNHRYVFEEALFNSGRPVIVVPQDGGRAEARTIVIAWDGSARAARAVSDALPLLAVAERVSIATVTGEKDLTNTAPGSDLEVFLARHGVKATTAALTTGRGDAGEALHAHAAEIGADLMVMGAFVHSRFRQAVLGGVTRSLLSETRIPLFMAY